MIDEAGLPSGDPKAAVERVFEALNRRFIRLSPVIAGLLLVSGDGISLKHAAYIAESVRAPLHPTAQIAFGCYLESGVDGGLSVKLILTGNSTWEAFVGPKENWQRKFERRWGIPPPMEIPQFLERSDEVGVQDTDGPRSITDVWTTSLLKLPLRHWFHSFPASLITIAERLSAH